MAVQTWCTTGDLKEQLGDSLYDAFTDDIDQPDEFVEDIIEAATGEARSYILARYEEVCEGWVATSAPKKVRRAVRDIAIYEMATHRINPTAPSATIDVWRQRYEDAIEWLKAIAAGDAVLDVDVIAGQRGGTRGRIVGADREAVF